MKGLVFLLILMFPLFGNTQSTEFLGDSLDSVPQVEYQSPYYRLYNSVGIFPEIQFIKSPIVSVSASYSHYIGGEGGASGQGINLGFEGDPLQKFYGPKLSVWAAGMVFFFGGNVSLSTTYYFQDDRGGWYLRPEVGIGLPLIHLKYGYGFRLQGDEIIGVPRHSLTLGGHIPIFKLKAK